MLLNCYDYIRGIDIKIAIDGTGKFMDSNLIVGTDTYSSFTRIICAPFGNTDFLTRTDPIGQVPALSNSTFTYKTTTINAWNNENKAKAPSLDCISSPPCEGIYSGDN